MDGQFLEAGKIVNTHGIRGEVKIMPWADSPDFLTGFGVLFIDGQPRKVLSSKVHKNCVIAKLDGVDSIESAIRLKNKTVLIDRSEAKLEAGRHFVADIIGLRAQDYDTGAELGVVSEVLSLPANDVYVIKGQREILVPAVSEFIAELNIDGGFVKIRLIEGM